MSWLLRRHWPLAWAGWRDLDAEHDRPDENPIQRPWQRVNSNRTVWLENNVLKINDYSETVFQLGGVSYEKQPFTENWGHDFDLNIDGNIIQIQYFAASIGASWANVGFGGIAGCPSIFIWRDAFSGVNEFRLGVVRPDSNVDFLANTITLSGLMNRSWYRLRILVDRDRLVRVYYGGITTGTWTLWIQHWLPEHLASSPGKRALSFLNQTSAWSEMKNYRVFDHDTIFKTATQWSNEVKFDDFNRANGAVGNGWTQYGVNAGIVNNSWSTTGTTDGDRGLVVDTGVAHGAQRVEATIGGNIGPNTGADASLILRCNSTGDAGIAVNVYSSAIFLARFTGALTGPTMTDFTSTPVAVNAGDRIAVSIIGDGAWVEVNDAPVLFADVNGLAPAANSRAGLKVCRRSGTNSASWNDVRVLTTA